MTIRKQVVKTTCFR